MRLYVVRHADPGYASDTLTRQGELEAEALGARLAAERVDHLLCSITGRSLATADRIAAATGLVVRQERWLNEPGHLRVTQGGKTYSLWDTFGETVRALQPRPDAATWWQCPPFDDPAIGEAWRAFTAACDAMTASFGYVREGDRYRVERRSDARVAIVGHNGTVLLFLAHLLVIPVPVAWCGFYAWPGSLTVFHFEEQSTTWAAPRALCVADTGHLRSAGLEPQPRGMGAGLFEQYR